MSEKKELHPRNLHNVDYDLQLLATSTPELNHHIVEKFGKKTIDFTNPEAVKLLNMALLKQYYGVDNWNIPSDFLCAPVPGRADYIHHIADLLVLNNEGEIPKGEMVSGLDIGVGANLIYPLLGNAIYGWSFVATDIDKRAIRNCVTIIEKNSHLQEVISLQLQPNPRFIFKDIIAEDDRFTFTICNPPFHASAEIAAKTAARKNENLIISNKNKAAELNFGGQNAELYCEGGELGFITQMIYESAKYKKQVFWFTSLVSKQENIQKLSKILKKVAAVEVKVVEMAQGNKKSRFIAWTFQSSDQQRNWKF